MAHQLDDIVKLQGALSALTAAEEQISGIPEWMQELHAEYSQHKAEIEALEEQVEQARRERRQAEAEIEDLQERLKRYQQQINQVSTQREYGALLHEIDTVKGQISTAEETGLGAMAVREEAEQKLAAEREAFTQVDTRYGEELARWEAEKPAIAARIEVLRGEIAVLQDRLPRGLVRQFERIRERYAGQGIAPILEVDRGRGPRFWHCGACNYSVRPQVVLEVRSTGSMHLCDGCKRILYIPGVEEGA